MEVHPKAGWADHSGVLNSVSIYVKTRPFWSWLSVALFVGARRELCWEQQPRRQSLNLQVEDKELQGTAELG